MQINPLIKKTPKPIEDNIVPDEPMHEYQGPPQSKNINPPPPNIVMRKLRAKTVNLISDFGMILLLQPVTIGTATAQSIPDWVKNNTDWWTQGLISHKDFAVGLGFMVKEKIIQVDNVQVDPNGDIEISDDIQLPDWIQNNARW